MVLNAPQRSNAPDDAPPEDPASASPDLIIVGAGPAGATLARLLGDSFSVLLIDSRNFPSSRDLPASSSAVGDSEHFGTAGATFREKCCGGLLAPDAQAMLERMGLSLPGFVRDGGQPLAVRALDLASGLARRYPRPYINLRRPAFERWLLSLLPPRVQFRPGARFVGASPLPGGTGWRVRLRGGFGGEALDCRMLVGADGAFSGVRRLMGAMPRPAARYLAIQESFSPPHGPAPGADAAEGPLSGGTMATKEYTAFFDPALTDFYGWVIPKQNEILLGLALPQSAARSSGRPGSPGTLMLRARQALERHGFIFSGPGRRSGCPLLRPAPGDIFLGRDNVFCIGEAAGWISPSSAEGFSYAFASALALADALRGAPSLERALAAYHRKTLPLRATIAWKQAKSLVMFTPPLRRLIMRSGLLAG